VPVRVQYGLSLLPTQCWSRKRIVLWRPSCLVIVTVCVLVDTRVDASADLSDPSPLRKPAVLLAAARLGLCVIAMAGLNGSRLAMTPHPRQRCVTLLECVRAGLLARVDCVRLGLVAHSLICACKPSAHACTLHPGGSCPPPAQSRFRSTRHCRSGHRHLCVHTLVRAQSVALGDFPAAFCSTTITLGPSPPILTASRSARSSRRAGVNAILSLF
jgi:hypothetical protein